MERPDAVRRRAGESLLPDFHHQDVSLPAVRRNRVWGRGRRRRSYTIHGTARIIHGAARPKKGVALIPLLTVEDNYLVMRSTL